MEKRLQTLKLPRDLTLGGTKPKKPAFVPNLNVARNKEKSLAFLKKTDGTAEKHYNNKRDRTSNKRTDGTERFIQSSGIFSDGIGSDAIKKARYERASGGGSSRDDTQAFIPIPTVKKEDWKIDDKNETKVYDKIMGCDSSSDDSDSLPFKPLPWDDNFLKESTVPNKHEVKVEHDAPVVVALDEFKEEDIPQEYLNTDLGTGDKPHLAIWSLPDSFAGRGLSDDPNVKTIFDYKLSNMPEGQIGKILVRQSGRVEVDIGGIKYDLNPAQLETFKEEIVEIDNANNSSSNSTSKPVPSVVMGEIQSRFNLTPDWGSLMKDL